MPAKSGFLSSPFALSAVTVLGIVGTTIAGITAPWAVIAAPIVTAVYTLANAWVKSQQAPSVDDAVQAAVSAALSAYHAANPAPSAANPAVQTLPAFGGMTATEATAAKKVVDTAELNRLQSVADAAAAALVKAQQDLAAAHS